MRTGEVGDPDLVEAAGVALHEGAGCGFEGAGYGEVELVGDEDRGDAGDAHTVAVVGDDVGDAEGAGGGGGPGGLLRDGGEEPGHLGGDAEEGAAAGVGDGGAGFFEEGDGGTSAEGGAEPGGGGAAAGYEDLRPGRRSGLDEGGGACGVADAPIEDGEEDAGPVHGVEVL